MRTWPSRGRRRVEPRQHDPALDLAQVVVMLYPRFLGPIADTPERESHAMPGHCDAVLAPLIANVVKTIEPTGTPAHLFHQFLCSIRKPFLRPDPRFVHCPKRNASHLHERCDLIAPICRRCCRPCTRPLGSILHAVKPGASWRAYRMYSARPEEQRERVFRRYSRCKALIAAAARDMSSRPLS
jgi:hypothetical protein